MYSKITKLLDRGLYMSSALKEKWFEILISTILGVSILAGGWVFASSIENGKSITALEEGKMSVEKAGEMEIRLSFLDPEVVRFMDDIRGDIRDLKKDMKDDMKDMKDDMKDMRQAIQRHLEVH